MKVLLFSSLYPNNAQPNFGVFVENRLHQLMISNDIEARVLAPVPWFPFKQNVFGKYASFAKVKKYEFRNRVHSYHPRYFVLPKFGMNYSPETMYRSALKVATKIIQEGYNFDVIDAHYFYPDGVAAVKLSQTLGKPVVITARGTDINLIAQFDKPRKKILWAAENADHIISVAAALKKKMIDLGINPQKITVLRNGVNLSKFKPLDNRDDIRSSLNFRGKTIISVGNLVKLKGHDLVIKSMMDLPDVTLFIVGEGEERDKLESLVAELKLNDRVSFMGNVDHERMPEIYAAADMLVLASSREGMANVLLESLACGTPVVATDVGGAAEIISTNQVGMLVKNRDEKSIAKNIDNLFRLGVERTQVRKFAEQFSWDATSKGQMQIFTGLKHA